MQNFAAIGRRSSEISPQEKKIKRQQNISLLRKLSYPGGRVQCKNINGMTPNTAAIFDEMHANDDGDERVA